MLRLSNPIVRGAIAGAIGAIVLALWFLVIDVMHGAPFHAPIFVASALFGLDQPQPTASLLIMYTVVHFAAFIVVGIVVTWLLEHSETPPHFLLGIVLGFLLFDVVFYLGVIVTGVNVVRALGWPEVLIGNVLAGIALMSYLSLTAETPYVSWREVLRQHRVLREGLIAGMLGAISVALWFLVIDLVNGRLFFTPAALGSAVFLGARSTADVQVTAAIVIGYTILHFGAFIVTGGLASALLAEAEKDPPMLLGLALFFVTFEVLSLGLIAIVATWLLDTVPWWTIVAANLIAAVAMGIYLWRAHPNLQKQLGRPLEEEEKEEEIALGADTRR